MKTWLLKLRERILSKLGIPVDLDKYDYIVEGNPLRKEYSVYWRKDIVYSAEYPDYWYYTVNNGSTFIQNTTRGHLPEGGYRVRNKEKEQEVRRQIELEMLEQEEIVPAALFVELKDKQGQYDCMQMLLKMEEVLQQVAPEYSIKKDGDYYRVYAKRKNSKRVSEIVRQFEGTR